VTSPCLEPVLSPLVPPRLTPPPLSPPLRRQGLLIRTGTRIPMDGQVKSRIRTLEADVEDVGRPAGTLQSILVPEHGFNSTVPATEWQPFPSHPAANRPPPLQSGLKGRQSVADVSTFLSTRVLGRHTEGRGPGGGPGRPRRTQAVGPTREAVRTACGCGLPTCILRFAACTGLSSTCLLVKIGLRVH
jgi:hypothetical protein